MIITSCTNCFATSFDPPCRCGAPRKQIARGGDEFIPRRRPGINLGILAASYMPFGGTETFHRTLVPRITRLNIVGFVSTSIKGGDPALLGCPYGHGVEAARALVRQCDVVMSWGVDCLRSILPTPRPKVVIVHHGAPDSEWSNGIIADQRGLWDVAACVCPQVEGVHIENGVDPERIKPNRSREEIRRAYGFGGNRVVLWAARLSSEKGLEKALEAAAALPSGWLLVVAGSGPEERLLANVDRGKIRYVGALDSPGDLLSVSDAFLSTATSEGFGLSMAEAMAARVPVIATPEGIATDRALCTHIDKLATGREIAAAIVAAADFRSTVSAAYKASVERWGAERFVSKWEDLLLGCCEHPSRYLACAHRGLHVGRLECNCGSLYHCKLLNKLCSPRAPFDNLAMGIVGDDHFLLTSDNYQPCDSCGSFTLPAEQPVISQASDG